MAHQLNTLFNVPVLFKETKINTKPLFNYINKISKNSKIVNSNVGGTHSEFFDLGHPVLDDLKKEIIQNIDSMFSECKFKSKNMFFQNKIVMLKRCLIDFLFSTLKLIKFSLKNEFVKKY